MRRGGGLRGAAPLHTPADSDCAGDLASASSVTTLPGLCREKTHPQILPTRPGPPWRARAVLLLGVAAAGQGRPRQPFMHSGQQPGCGFAAACK